MSDEAEPSPGAEAESIRGPKQPSIGDEAKRFALDAISRSLESPAKVKLAGGITGRFVVALTATVSAIVAIIIGASFGLLAPWLAALAIVLVFMLGVGSLYLIKDYADKNPITATLEGAELLLHQHLLQGMKSQPVLDVIPGSLTTDPSRQLPPIDATVMAEPDKPLSGLLTHSPPASDSSKKEMEE